MYYLFVSKMNYYYENLFEKILLIRFFKAANVLDHVDQQIVCWRGLAVCH